jgi:hypothetical protein
MATLGPPVFRENECHPAWRIEFDPPHRKELYKLDRPTPGGFLVERSRTQEAFRTIQSCILIVRIGNRIAGRECS